MKIAFIINPAAGRGRTAKLWPSLETVVKATGKLFATHFTTGPGDAQRLARELSRQGYRRLLVAGGDGTVNEVLNGLELDQVQLGVVPTGTGNDFCRMLGLSKKPQEALAQLLDGKTRRMDIGLVNGRRFLNAVGVGFDADVVKEVNVRQEQSRVKGTLAYLIALVQVLRHYRTPKVTVETEGASFTGKMLLVEVGNGQYVGGGMRLMPPAQIDDGVFHVCLVGDASKGEVLANVPRLVNGTHLSHPKFSMLTARELVITGDRPLTVHADGEVIGETPVKIAILPQALEVLVP